MQLDIQRSNYVSTHIPRSLSGPRCSVAPQRRLDFPLRPWMAAPAGAWSTTIILHYQRQLKITIEAGLFFIRFVVLDSELFQPPGCNGAFGALGFPLYPFPIAQCTGRFHLPFLDYNKTEHVQNLVENILSG